MDRTATKLQVRVGVAAALACALSTTPWTAAEALETLFDISVGGRHDDLRWSIPGLGGTPNVASELIWRRVESVPLSLSLQTVSDSGLTVQARLSSGKIRDGMVEDHDYLGNNRTGLFLLSEAETNDDDVNDASLAFGKAFIVTDTRSTSVTPLIGASWHEQDFHITDGTVVFDPVGGSGRPIPGLDSRYKTEWKSVFLGAQVDYRGSRWHTFGRVEYHDVDYEAKARWNLRGDYAQPLSFRHDASGSGTVYHVGARFAFNSNWALNASYLWSNWSTSKGTETDYLADGRAIENDLNRSSWESDTVMLGISYVSSP